MAMDNKEIEKIRVFIAGSKGLTNSRNLVRSLLSKKNADLDAYAKQYCIIAYDYESLPKMHLDDYGLQKVYNLFINKIADICVFIFDGKIGGITREEFEVAQKTMKRNVMARKFPRPNIYSFATIATKDENPEDIRKQIQAYYVDFANESDLEKNINEMIDNYIEKHKNSKLLDQKNTLLNPNNTQIQDQIQQNILETMPKESILELIMLQTEYVVTFLYDENYE